MLGVGRRASGAEIRKAYHALAARYHPDKHQDNVLEDLAREKLALLNDAYRVLNDPDLRGAYDAARAGSRAAGGEAPPGPAPPPAPPRRAPRGSWSGLATVLMLIAAVLLFRLVRNPKALIPVGIALALAWFGPRIWRYLKR